MVAGLSGKVRIAAVIQARMKSSRLPGKILMPLPFPDGKPVLGWVIESVKRSNLIDHIVLASSTNPENDILERFCSENAVELFRGSEEDVLSRFIAIARKGFDVLVRLTGDNPIVDAAILDEVVAHHIAEGNDYTKSNGLPIGMNFEIISSEALFDAERVPLKDSDREHVVPFVRNSPRFKKGEFLVPTNPNLERIRLTVDYPSDYALLSLILNALPPGELPGLKHITHLHDTQRWLLAINEGNYQKKTFDSVSSELEEAIMILNKYELTRAIDVLQNAKQSI